MIFRSPCLLATHLCARTSTHSNSRSFFFYFLFFLVYQLSLSSRPPLTYIVPLFFFFFKTYFIFAFYVYVRTCRAFDSVNPCHRSWPSVWRHDTKLINDAIHLRRTESSLLPRVRPSRNKNTRRAIAVAIETVAVALALFFSLPRRQANVKARG